MPQPLLIVFAVLALGFALGWASLLGWLPDFRNASADQADIEDDWQEAAHRALFRD
ncbi:hypothetical protein [Saccharopolyspora taberi]|uniref:Uncharacterized protein n=1 Tax=Saccharopolyspora taberi TaxID=60895 RepID=A0ABN3VM90_9PSEU